MTSVDLKAPDNRDTSHRGTLFRSPGRAMWHAEGHREYGVLWSVCGIRALAAQAETCTTLPEGGALCAKCEAPPRR